MKRIVAGLAAGLLLLGGCGGDDDVTESLGSDDTGAGAPQGEPPPGPAGTSDPEPDTSVSSPAQPGPDGGPDREPPAPMLVTPRPGMVNLHDVTWEKATARSERVVRVQFYGGVEPCYVLDSARVDYREDAVEITLVSGSDPAEPDAVCIEIAQLKAVDVTLDENLAGRELVDGAAK